MIDILLEILAYLWDILQNLFRLVIVIYLMLFLLKKFVFESKKVSGRFKIDKKFTETPEPNLFDWRPLNIELAKKVCEDCRFTEGGATLVDLGTGIKEAEFSCKQYCKGMKHKDLGYFEGTLIACEKEGKKVVVVVRNPDRRQIGIVKDSREDAIYGKVERDEVYNFVKGAGICYPCWGSITRTVSEKTGEMYYHGNLCFAVNPGLVDESEINKSIRMAYEGWKKETGL